MEEFSRAKLHRLRVNDSLDDLTLDLLEWLDAGPRPYSEVLDAWRTSCPRLPVWENASNLGFVERGHVPAGKRPIRFTVSHRRRTPHPPQSERNGRPISTRLTGPIGKENVTRTQLP